MRDAAGYLTERFHLLRLQQLFVGPLQRFRGFTMLVHFAAQARVGLLQRDRPFLDMPLQLITRVEQNLFGALSFRDISGNATERVGRALRVAQSEPDREKGVLLSIGLRGHFLELDRFVTGHRFQVIRPVDIRKFRRKKGVHIPTK